MKIIINIYIVNKEVGVIIMILVARIQIAKEEENYSQKQENLK